MSDQNQHRGTTRRRFLKLAVTGVAALPLAGAVLPAARAGGGELPRLDEGDPQARGLQYVHDANQSATAEEGQYCHNCSYFSNGQDGWGRCTIFSRAMVSSRGWCTAWSPA